MGAGRPNCGGPLAEGRAPLAQPVLEVLQAGDVGELLLALVVLQRPALADDLLLLAEDDADVVGVELAVEHQRLGEDVLGLLERQPARRMDQPLAALGVEVDGDPRLVLDVVDDPVEQAVEVVDRGRAELDDRDVLGQLDRDLHERRDEDDRLVRVAQGVGDVAEAADVPQVAGADPDIEVVVQVLEQEDRRVDMAEHGVEARDRVARVARAGLASLRVGAELDDALAARPDVQRLVPPLGDLEQPLLEPLLLPGHDVDDRVAGADQDLELVGRPRRRSRAGAAAGVRRRSAAEAGGGATSAGDGAAGRTDLASTGCGSAPFSDGAREIGTARSSRIAPGVLSSASIGTDRGIEQPLEPLSHAGRRECVASTSTSRARDAEGEEPGRRAGS